jgi:hypothetical protein
MGGKQALLAVTYRELIRLLVCPGCWGIAKIEPDGLSRHHRLA